MSQAEVISLMKQVNKLQEQRDELAAALKQLCRAKTPLDWSPTLDLVEAFAQARAALAKLEGSK